MVMKYLALVLALVVTANESLAAVNSGGVVNAASFAPYGIPSAGIAQGSMFLVFGSDLGEPGLTQAKEFPLTSELAGTSIEVTVGSVTVDCLMVFVTPGQLAAVLPSHTPAGKGMIRVRYNGVVSTGEIRVTTTTVGIFTQSQTGRGPGVVQNFESPGDTPLNTVFEPARIGQAVIIWVTGLGGVEGDDGSGPLPAARPSGVSVRVLIGGRDAQIIDYGRSGCCVGIDQIVAVIPEGVSGCYAPLFVVTEKDGASVTSNAASVAVSEEGEACPANLFPPADLVSDEDISFGVLTLGRTRAGVVIPGLGASAALSDLASGVFSDLPRNQFLAMGFPFQLVRRGACEIFPTFLGQGGRTDLPGLDAGETLGLQSPNGDRDVSRLAIPGTVTDIYQLNASAALDTSGRPRQPNDLFLDPGEHTLEGSGGMDVGAFSVTEDVPDLMVWTNNETRMISRASPHTVRWTGGNPKDAVVISGTSTFSTIASDQVTVTFVCFANVEDRQFEIPTYVLQSLPPSEVVGGTPLGTLAVGAQSLGKRFAAPGLDFGMLSYTLLNSETGVGYE